MKSISIKASKRTETGKKVAKSLRAEGMVPGILYGNGEQTLIQIDARELKDLIYTPHVYLVDLDVDGKTVQCILKDIQFHPVTDNYEHIDFLAISQDKPVQIAIPVVPVGTARGVINGGKMVMVRRKIRVKGLPSALPDTIEIPVAKLKIGQSVKIKDVNIEGLELVAPPNDVIISIRTTRKIVEDDEEDEDEEGAAEGAEGEGEDAPAAEAEAES